MLSGPDITHPRMIHTADVASTFILLLEVTHSSQAESESQSEAAALRSALYPLFNPCLKPSEKLAVSVILQERLNPQIPTPQDPCKQSSDRRDHLRQCTNLCPYLLSVINNNEGPP